MAAAPSNLVLLGSIAGAHGIRGEVRIKPYTEDPERLAAYGPLRDGGGRRFEIQSLRVVKGGVVARLEGVTNRDDAEALKGVELYVERTRLPEPDEGEWYQSDLVGLVAMDAGGSAIGTVVAVQNFGAGDLLEIRPATGGQSVLVPFTEEVVPNIDAEGGWLLVHPPEGLFD